MSKGKLLSACLGIIVLAIVVVVFAVKDVRNGFIETLKGTVHDSVTMIKGDGASPSPAPVVTPKPSESQPIAVAEVPAPENLKIHVLNTSGTAVLVVEGKSTLLIDGSDGSDSAKIASQIKSFGVSKLQYVVATNYHDIAIAGLPKIMSYFSTDYIFMSQNVADDKKGDNLRKYLSSTGLVWTVPSERAKFKLGNSYFELLPTHDGGSLVTVVSNGDNKFVFTGDINRVDDPLIRQLPVGVDMLYVSARNSYYELPKQVLGHLKPKNVVLGNNSEDAASIRAEGVLKGLKTNLYKTNACGNVAVGSNGKDVSFNCDNKSKKN